MFLAFARRSVRILPQVRMLRSNTATATRLSTRRAPDRSSAADNETVFVGETVVEKYEKFQTPKKNNALENPAVMTLVQEHRMEIDEKAEPKDGFTEAELQLFDQVEEIKIDDALKNYKQSKINAEYLDSIGPGLKATFNVAALANQHAVIKNLVDLGVPVYKWDSKPNVLHQMVKLNWEKDCRPKIDFFITKCGFEASILHKVLGRNPLLLTEELQHLEARLAFLSDQEEGLGIRKKDITRILSKEALWLSTPIEAIQNKMNFFKNHYAFTESEFKKLIVARPQVLMTQLRKLMVTKFSMIEEMGFSQGEIKQAIMNGPKILTMNRVALIDRFQTLHLDMGFDQKLLASQSMALYCRGSRLRERHGFLKFLGRDRFDRTLPGYVSPLKIASGTDEDFVENVANSTKEVFEKYIKSL